MAKTPPSVALSGRALEDWLRRIAGDQEFAEVCETLGVPRDFRQVASKILSMEAGSTSEQDRILQLYRKYVVKR